MQALHAPPFRINFFRIFLFLLLTFTGFCANAQAAGPAKWQVGLNFSNGLSYTGYNLYLQPELSYGRHNIYVGPKFVASDSYAPYNNIWGVNFGYRYDILSNAHWRAGVGLDVQSAFYKPYNPYNLETDVRHNKVYEMFFMLSLYYHFQPQGRLYIGANIGSGFFSESYHDLIADDVNRNFDRTSMVSFTVGYKIFRK